MKEYSLVQVYCDGEHGVNEFLKRNYEVIEVIDIKYALNAEGEGIMVVYKTQGELK